MKKILGYGFIGLLLVALVGSIFAYKGDPTVQGPYYNEKRHDLMVKAFENLDYESWHNLMIENGRSPGVLRFVNEDNFATFVKLRDARIANDIELVEQLENELGIKQGHGMKKGAGNSGNKGLRNDICMY